MRELEAIYKQKYIELNANDRYIMSYIMDHIEEVAEYTIAELAEKVLTSKSSVMRFTKKLGFSGYSEFKHYIVFNLDKEKEEDINYLNFMKSDIKQTQLLFEETGIDEILRAMYDASKILTYGTGWAQRNTLNEFRRLMIPSKKFVINLEAVTEMEHVIDSIVIGDCLIILSLSGKVNDIVDIVKLYQIRGVKVVAIVGNSDSILAKVSDFQLYFNSTDYSYRGQHMQSVLPAYVVTNLLFQSYIGYDVNMMKKIEENKNE